MIDRLSEPTPKESPLYSRVITTVVSLSHNDGRPEPVFKAVQFDGWIDRSNNVQYYKSNTYFVFEDGFDALDFDNWHQDVTDSLREQGFKNLDDL